MALLTPAPLNFRQTIRSELVEALQLNWGDIFPTVLHLRTTLASGGVSGAATLPSPGVDTYRMPGDYSLIVSEIRAHVAINMPSQEAAGPSGFLTLPDYRDRVVAKAMNARATLVNADRDNLKAIETDSTNSASPIGSFATLALSTLLPVAGGCPLKLISETDVMPLIVCSNERLRLTVQLNDAETGLGATEYGLVLMGAFVRSRGV